MTNCSQTVKHVALSTEKLTFLSTCTLKQVFQYCFWAYIQSKFLTVFQQEKERDRGRAFFIFFPLTPGIHISEGCPIHPN